MRSDNGNEYLSDYFPIERVSDDYIYFLFAVFKKIEKMKKLPKAFDASEEH